MMSSSLVAVVHARQREAGIREAVALLGGVSDMARGKHVVLKPNYNSHDPFPASTHEETAAAVICLLREAGASKVTVAERSGIAWDSHDVAAKKGLHGLFASLGAEYVILDDLPADAWTRPHIKDSHWRRGIELPRLVLEADAVVMTCCLKTHAYGGHFTMSLKNAVGLVPVRSAVDGYTYMEELHDSPHQRRMIAEINTAFRTDLVLLDAMSAFVTGGPMQGDVVHPGLILASADRVAVDAAGVGVLRCFDTTREVMRGSIFSQEQIRRAAELGVGAASAADIQLLPASDPESQAWARRIRARLDA